VVCKPDWFVWRLSPLPLRERIKVRVKMRGVMPFKFKLFPLTLTFSPRGRIDLKAHLKTHLKTRFDKGFD
jgi:hypothetical protein